LLANFAIILAIDFIPLALLVFLELRQPELVATASALALLPFVAQGVASVSHGEWWVAQILWLPGFIAGALLAVWRTRRAPLLLANGGSGRWRPLPGDRPRNGDRESARYDLTADEPGVLPKSRPRGTGGWLAATGMPLRRRDRARLARQCAAWPPRTRGRSMPRGL
jgi:hypothetical protein